VVDRRRHPVSARYLAPPLGEPARGLPHVYRGRSRRTLRDIFEADHAEAQAGGRFRWLVSTSLAGAVGAVGIFAVIYGAADPRESSGGFLPSLQRMRASIETVPELARAHRVEGLRWNAPRSDRLQTMSGAASTRFIIHETMKQRRNGRDYIHAKPYVRVLARLMPVPSDAEAVPPFNPFKLYANAQPISARGEEDGEIQGPRSDVSIRVVELLGGILPGEDGQELDNQEVSDLLRRTEVASAEEVEVQAPLAGEVKGTTAEATLKGTLDAQEQTPNTTVLTKTGGDLDDTSEDLETREVRVVKVAKGDTLAKILVRAGAEDWLARAMIEAARNVFKEDWVAPGQEVHITLVPSLVQQNRMEPIRFSVFADGHDHKVTVARSAAGEFVASGTPFDAADVARAARAERDQPQSSSLYAGLYHAARTQQVPSETIQQILRVHAYDSDFRRRLRAGDQVEFFFDLKEEAAPDAPPGELLFTSITAGAETSRFYRFRTPDGVVDYYDDKGNNSKKFLLRRPVRADDARLTSGFGVRFHPLLNERKMHTGVDWAASPNTPILAAGAGVIEEVGRKGQYGNYVRIRHANGYQTAYGHMMRFAEGAAEGVKVRQGQIIGYVGSTGLSSGPHLHFEVLVNSRFVDPLTIQVPRECQLTGRQLADFQKERARIEELMRRSPVMTASK
jgi:murein DD-endopeptidase MepM/ murein hydrolase activator NlpD